jgi:hypothetical protein
MSRRDVTRLRSLRPPVLGKRSINAEFTWGAAASASHCGYREVDLDVADDEGQVKSVS